MELPWKQVPGTWEGSRKRVSRTRCWEPGFGRGASDPELGGKHVFGVSGWGLQQ